MRLLYMIVKAGLVGLRSIYGCMKLRPCKPRVTIISRQSNTPSVDIALLADYLTQHHPDLQVKVMCRAMEKTNKIIYCGHMLRQMWNLSVSPVVIADGYCIAVSVLNHRRETKVIQMWHALAAVKQFGYQTVGKPGGRSRQIARLLCMHRNYDYILCPGKEVSRQFQAAFGAEEEQMLYMGLPRIDKLTYQVENGPLRAHFGIRREKEILLYIPTFRRGEEVPLDDLVKAVDLSRFTLVIRLHPLEEISQRQREALAGKEGVILDTAHSSYEWLQECDRIITDYSALGIEATLTGKPLYFYLYDLDKYQRSVGLNIDLLSEMPTATAVTSEELGEALSRSYDYEMLRRFRDRYISVDTDHCTQRLGEFVYGIVKKVH